MVSSPGTAQPGEPNDSPPTSSPDSTAEPDGAGSTADGVDDPHVFGRRIATHLAGLLQVRVADPRYRSAPVARRPGATDQYEFTVDGCRVQITRYPVGSPHVRRHRTEYQIHLDGQRVPFAPRYPQQLIETQIATTIAGAVFDHRQAARRADQRSGRPWQRWRP
ncbi:hypothetical protein [Actinoplanes regularis]|uniref:Uncharacterized protein n=1 Tax=Actinoplanes regularis TaxID=52697 RepID=A0A238XJV4_9ACTN|nr:hypothetical protein [Actinoplanes regularis]GIE90499.1 hypothetical protein Are01nite_69790 [Actinoplanes regularis]SNR58753.1 hypothetical protein SAMN06264365_103491 [Actinoplanes regularis]